MNWRQLWQSTMANVRAIFSTRPPTPPAKPQTPRPLRPTPGVSESPARPLLPPPSTPPVIDLARRADEPQAPLRRRPQIRELGTVPGEMMPPTPQPDRIPPYARRDDTGMPMGGFGSIHRPPTPEQRAQAALLHRSIHAVTARVHSPAALPGPTAVEATWVDTQEPDVPGAGRGGGFDDGHHGHNGSGAGNNGFGSNGHPGDGTGGKPELPVSALLESLLFVAAEPVDPLQLARTLALPLDQVEQGLTRLGAELQEAGRGLRLQRFKGRVQLVTAPAAAAYIETFLNLDTTAKLSGPALETLAVIAYRQPVTRAQIEAVRGVDCAGVLKSLVQRGLVGEVGRLESVGRPILYGVTELFMQHFGLVGMDQLPPLEETEADRLWAATVLAEEGIAPAGSAASGRVEGQ